MKIRKKEKQLKSPKVHVMKVGIHRKWVIFLWILLISSVAFGIYKNFTAINRHTVHETKVIEKQVIDINPIENFIKNFAKVYYSWKNNQNVIDQRTEALKGYLTKELQDLNIDTIRRDIPTSSSVNDVEIWKVRQIDEHEYAVIFSVDQLITEGHTKKAVNASYEVGVYMDKAGNMVIVRNPTICEIPVKSGYEPKAVENDGTVNGGTTEEINVFLKTFFKLYPTASKEELSYYVKDNVLKPIGKDYVFSEMINPVYRKVGNQVQVSVSVKYLDQQTKATQISQLDLTLQKDKNWMIVK
ncbi:conjugal transfer protein [Sporolactobacillus nakayamae]|uniref:Conjugal transfer protein n=2 Tax=Bacillales TaxID=1385 RepID=A0A6N8CNB6_9BACI|nr:MULTISPECIES: conjugal transfer protein [Bacillales]MTT31609.1 conjugal transfer protein [Terrilactibacillus tamarindi]SFG93729.1 Conjugative transposon protein TcpC [Sporolactobacillus nakayamae]